MGPKFQDYYSIFCGLGQQFSMETKRFRNTRDKTIIVLHDTETGSLQETIAALEDEGLSVTYIVDIDGQVYQYVRDSRRAWHAGSGIWRGDGQLWKDLWTSKMTYENQSKVLLNATIKDDNLKTQVQQLLYNHGYGTVNVGDPYDSTTKGKVTTAMAIQSFNRKFCPEVVLS
ncbi:unnamed protein product, partial [Mesorhabditis belari]|uniref:N-acetylmuramoyl-L-alanine amidase n=1 Tax=Mesorhabditis belari TaxID=2138241 RepID=A0AAF3J3U1_9BILA